MHVSKPTIDQSSYNALKMVRCEILGYQVSKFGAYIKSDISTTCQIWFIFQTIEQCTLQCTFYKTKNRENWKRNACFFWALAPSRFKHGNSLTLLVKNYNIRSGGRLWYCGGINPHPSNKLGWQKHILFFSIVNCSP